MVLDRIYLDVTIHIMKPVKPAKKVQKTKRKKTLTIEELVKRVSGVFGDDSGRVITNAEVLKMLKEYP